MLELKNELVDLELTDFNYNDSVLIEQNLTPCEAEVIVPKYFLRERETEIAARKEIMAKIIEDMNSLPSVPSQG
jgi:hypothetical protein